MASIAINSIDWIEPLSIAFRSSVSDLIVMGVRGALLYWLVIMGKILGTGFFESPTWKKVGFISMPIAVVIAVLFALYSFRLVNPGETRAEAIQDAEETFFLVLLPLWAGCIWSGIRLHSKLDASDEEDD